MKIRVKDIILNYFPFETNSEEENTDCAIELIIDLGKYVEPITWKKNCVTFDVAKEIHECSEDKGICLLNIKHDNDVIEEFVKLKIEMFEDIAPKSNWTQYEIWADLKHKKMELNKKILKLEKVIWGDRTYNLIYKKEYNDTLNEMLKKIKPIHPPIQPYKPYQPIWIDENTDINNNPFYKHYTSNNPSGIDNSNRCAAFLLNSNFDSDISDTQEPMLNDDEIPF